MKKIISAIISLIVIPGIVIAQKTDQTHSPTEKKNAFQVRSSVMPLAQMDQRKIYNWGNGQRSTPTGRIAGESGFSYARVLGDSAVLVRNPFDKNGKKSGSYSKK